MKQVLLRVSKVVWTGLEIGRIGRPAKVSENELQAGVSLLDKRLDVTEMLGSFEQHITDESNAVALVQFQRQRGIGRLTGLRTRGRFPVDRVLCQCRILRRGRLAGGSVLAVLLPLGFFLFRFRLLATPLRTGECIPGHDRLVPTRHVSRLHAATVSTISEGRRIVWSHKRDLHVRLDRRFESDCPETAVRQQAAEIIVQDVLGSALRGSKHAALFSRCAFVGPHPDGRGRLLALIAGRVNRHPVKRLNRGQNPAAFDRPGEVSARLGPGLLYPTQDRMVFCLRQNIEERALPMVSPKVAGPGLAKNLASETELKIIALVAVRILRKRAVRGNLETVRGSAQPDDRPAPSEVIHERLHLLFRQVLKTSEDDHQVGRLQRVHARDVRVAGNDFASPSVHTEQHGAFESVMPGEQPRQRGQRLF